MSRKRKPVAKGHTNVVGGKCPLPRYRGTTRVSWHVADQPPLGTRVYDEQDPRHIGRLEAVLWNNTYRIRFKNGVLADVPKKRVMVVQP